MTTPELITYIRERVAQGASSDLILKELIGVGWTRADAQEGLAVVVPNPVSIPTEKVIPQAQVMAASLSSVTTDVRLARDVAPIDTNPKVKVAPTPSPLSMATGSTVQEMTVGSAFKGTSFIGGAPVRPQPQAFPRPTSIPSSVVSPSPGSPASQLYPERIAKAVAATENLGYAGFWQRSLASLIDGAILSFILMVLLVAAVLFGKSSGQVGTFVLAAQLIWVLVGVLYFALGESSSAQATWGKRICGISLMRLDGGQVSFMRALGRYFAKILSSLILGVGFLMVGFTQKKQGLHDFVAGTVVIKRTSPRIWQGIVTLVVVWIIMAVSGGITAQVFVTDLLESFVEVSGGSKIPLSFSDFFSSKSVQTEPITKSSAASVTEEEYEQYVSSDPGSLSLNTVSAYKGSRTLVGPMVLAYQSFWIDVIAPMIPNIDSAQASSRVIIHHIWSKAGKDIYDPESPYEQDASYSNLQFEKRDEPIAHFHANRNLHIIDGAYESSISKIEGVLSLKLPLKGGGSFTRTYPFVLIRGQVL